ADSQRWINVGESLNQGPETGIGCQILDPTGSIRPILRWRGMDPLPNQRPAALAIGKYRILAELGQGGMADVYLAVANGPNGFSKFVVLKMLRKNLAADEELVALFLNEARLAARLNHANV